MALIKCPECGKEISDKTISCPSCGCPVVDSNDQKEGQQKQNRKILLIIPVIASIIIIGAVVYYFGVQITDRAEESKVIYQETIESRESEKESNNLLDEEGNENIAEGIDSKYDTAVNLMQDKKYKEASEIFNEISNYKDSREKLTECQYALGNEYMENEQWDSAMECFNSIDYKDSVDLKKQCEREKGMNENADYKFLADLEKSILNRMEASNQEADYEELVDNELEYLEKYEDADFYDEDLKRMAQDYINGVYEQKNSLYEYYNYKFDIKWLKGLIAREDALYELYNTYNFMSGNNDFISAYIVGYGENEKLLAAMEEIETDIDKQMKSENFQANLDADTQIFSFTLNNNTEHTYDTTFELSFLDTDNTEIEFTEVEIQNIKPHSSFDVSTYISNIYDISNFNYQNYYYNINYTTKSESGTESKDSGENITYKYYTIATSLSKEQLDVNSLGVYIYEDLPLTSDDSEWIDDPINDGSVNQGAIYRKLAMCLKGFSIGNDWKGYAKYILGFTPESREDFAKEVEDLKTYIVMDDPLTAVMKKFESLESITGTFDYMVKKYEFDIQDLKACANELKISEEMLGYIFAMLDEYAPEISFNANTCTFSYGK